MVWMGPIILATFLQLPTHRRRPNCRQEAKGSENPRRIGALPNPDATDANSLLRLQDSSIQGWTPLQQGKHEVALRRIDFQPRFFRLFFGPENSSHNSSLTCGKGNHWIGSPECVRQDGQIRHLNPARDAQPSCIPRCPKGANPNPPMSSFEQTEHRLSNQ